MAVERTFLERTLVELYQWACARLYREFAWSYDAVAATVSFGRWDLWRSAVLEHVHGPAVLELGFGTGALLPALDARHETAIGIELSPAMLRVARRKWRARGLAPTAVQASAGAIPITDNAIDTIVATFPAPYILESATLAEVRRVLRPGGALVVAGLWVCWTGSPSNLWQHLPVFYGEPSAETHARYRKILSDAGFRAELFDNARGDAAVGMLVAHVEKVP